MKIKEIQKRMLKYAGLMAVALTLAGIAGTEQAAAQSRSENTGVSRRSAPDRHRGDKSAGPGVTDRMQQFFENDGTADDSELKWMRVIYRELDLNKDENAPLYFPEEPVDGNENLFRIIMRLLASNQLKAYEYLDGREIFTEEYQVNVRDMLDRFHILYSQAKGSTERNPKFDIQESDVPANEILSYYIIERYDYDTRRNKLMAKVQAICPVLHRSGDFGGEAVKYPMFWIKMSDIRPWLAQQNIFTSDDNNLPSSTYDDYFTLNRYKGEIYKTRNLKNKSMAQLYPDPEAMKKAQDSIQSRLDNFDKKLWVPDREEVIAQREAKEAAEKGETVNPDEKASKQPVRSTKRSSRKTSKAKAPKVKESKVKSSSSSTATKSVRRRRK